MVKRVQPLWEEKISIDIKSGKSVLVVAHGSSLRAIVNLINPAAKEDEIKKFEIPHAVPIILTLNSDLKIEKVEYLGDES